MTWTKCDIRAARLAPLAPLLLARGVQLKPMPDENFLVIAQDDLIVKRHFWRWPSRNIHGNAIDYFVKVEGLTFNQSMSIITGKPHS